MMTDQPTTRGFELSDREHRWLTAFLVVATVAVSFLIMDYVGKWLMFFGDVIMIFFLAWLLAFILSPIANGVVRLVPRLPRWLAVILVYSLLIVALVVAILLIAQQLYSSIGNLINNWPQGDALRAKLQPGQDWLNSVGGGQISLYDQVTQLLANVKNGATDLLKPLGDIAVASVGIFGNLLFIFFLSLYMAVDRDRIVSFLFRLVPPAYSDEAQLLEHSVARSFGGFLRGQALMGLMYGAISMTASAILALPYMPVTAVSSGVLQAIPFFGPFISWAPPVLVAIFFKPDAAVFALAIMIAGWFVLMNIIQPRLMPSASIPSSSLAPSWLDPSWPESRERSSGSRSRPSSPRSSSTTWAIAALTEVRSPTGRLASWRNERVDQSESQGCLRQARTRSWSNSRPRPP
jgi:predicted PurR-regulated permease PerM